MRERGTEEREKGDAAMGYRRDGETEKREEVGTHSHPKGGQLEGSRH